MQREKKQHTHSLSNQLQDDVNEIKRARTNFYGRIKLTELNWSEVESRELSERERQTVNKYKV